MMIKGSVILKNVRSLESFVSNNRTSNYIKQKLIELQREINSQL